MQIFVSFLFPNSFIIYTACISLADKIYMNECLIFHDFKLAVSSESLKICMVYINLRCAHIEQQNLIHTYRISGYMYSFKSFSLHFSRAKEAHISNQPQSNIETSEKAT